MSHRNEGLPYHVGLLKKLKRIYFWTVNSMIRDTSIFFQRNFERFQIHDLVLQFACESGRLNSEVLDLPLSFIPYSFEILDSG
jgi:hypothetical protein